MLKNFSLKPCWMLICMLVLLGHPLLAQDSKSPAGTLAMKNVTVIDGTGAPPQAGQVVIVKDGIIEEIQPVKRWEPSGKVKVMDLDGHYIIPGLINGHVHLTAHQGNMKAHLQKMLSKGTTAVRDLGGDARTLSVLERDIRMGAIKGPDVYYSATFFGPAFTGDPRVRFSSMGYEVGTAPWAQQITEDTRLSLAVAQARGTGATGIKLYASLDASTVRSITDVAHRQGLKVWAHGTVFPASPTKILKAGVDGMEHMSLLRAVSQNTALPVSWSEGFNEWLPAQADSAGDFNPDTMDEFFKEAASREVAIGTTLHVAHRLATEKNLEPGWTPALGKRHKRWVCKATSAAHEAGVSLVAGTDLDGSVPVQEEMKLMVECGLSPLDAIRSATLEAAKAIGIEDSHGSIEARKKADLVILKSDPTQDIENTSDIARVMKKGEWVYYPDND